MLLSQGLAWQLLVFAGAAALLIAYDPTFRGKPVLIKKRLMETVDIKANLSGLVKSQGRLNVYNALVNKVNKISSTGKYSRKEMEYQSPSP